MPSKTDEIIAAFEELLKRRGTQKPTDRLGLERPIVSRDFNNQPMAGWEKAASLIGAAVSPASTIASMVLAPPQEESLFDRAITGLDGKTYYPETQQSVIPTAKNKAKFAADMREKAAQISGLPQNLFGLAYLQTRYPHMFKRFAQKGGKINISDKPHFTGENTPTNTSLGHYVPSTNTINIAEPATDAAAINTLMHELTHATRANRFSKDPKTWGHYYSTRNSGYNKNPEEIAARQAGRTAELGYAKYIDEFFPDESAKVRKRVKEELLREEKNRTIWRDKNDKRTRILPYETHESSWEDISIDNARRMGYLGTKSWRELLGDLFGK